MRIRKGRRIPRDDGKRIEELVGAATTGTASVSVAKMLAPPGWSEPAQTPEFDEVVHVLKGELTIVLGKKRERIAAGETGLVPRGERVVYRNDGGGACEYLSVCAPAFRPDLANIEAPDEATVIDSLRNEVQFEGRHPKSRAWKPKLIQLALQFMAELGVQRRELSLSLVDDRTIRAINLEWRDKDKATDVLSFPADPLPKGTPGRHPLGDVVISLDTATRVAKADGRPLEAELARYLAHGILHLLGHDHERSAAAERKMRKLEEKLLGQRGLI